MNQRAQLLKLLDEHFDQDKIAEICFVLDVDIENLKGETKRAKIPNLIQEMERSQRLAELIATAQELNPYAPWANYQIEILPAPLLPPSQASPFLLVDGFIGREAELAELAHHRANGERFFVVYGLAGMGKSWLVSYFVQQRLQLSPKEVFRYDFRLGADFKSLARAMSIHYQWPRVGDEAEDYFYELLLQIQVGKLTLFLDNFELVLDAQKRVRETEEGAWLAKFLDQLLTIEHTSTVYVTSRVLPELGTTVRAVPADGLRGLSSEESWRLFARHKGATAVTPAQWQEIDHLLKGHPKALELLGSVLNRGFYDLPELIQQMTTWQIQAPAGEFGQKVAEELLDNLYQRLDEATQASFRRTAVLRAPFSKELFAHLSHTPANAIPSLKALCDHSLMERLDQRLFTFHPLVGAYALARLPMEEGRECHRLAATFYEQKDAAQYPNGWQNEDSVWLIQEAIYHWQFADLSRASLLLEKVSTYLNTQGQNYYFSQDYEQSQKVLEYRIAQLDGLKELSETNRELYARLHVHLAVVRRRQNHPADEIRPLFQIASQNYPQYPRLWTVWAITEKEAGQIERARELFAMGTQVDPKNPYLWYTFAMMEKERGQSEEARKLFTKGTEANPKDGLLWQAWAMFEKEAGQIERARELFVHGTEADPKHAALWQAWAIMEKEAGQIERARELFAKGIQVDPQNAYLWHGWAVMEKKEGDILRARTLFQQGMETNPNDPRLLQTWVMMEKNTGEIVQARELFERGAKANLNSGWLWFIWAMMEKETGRIERARELFAKGTEADPTNAPLWEAWAILEKEVGDVAEARRLFVQGTEADPKDAPLWQAWAMMEREAGQIERARELFAKGTEADPKHAPLWQAWAMMEKEAGQIERARELFAKGTQICRDYTPLWQSWAVLEREASCIELAKYLLKQAYALNPQDPLTLQELGFVFGLSHEIIEARHYFQQALALTLPDYIFWSMWGRIELLAKAYKFAIEYLQKAVTLSPQDAFSWYLLGLAWEASSNDEQAEKCYDESVRWSVKLEYQAKAYFYKAKILSKTIERIADAEATFRLAIAADPKNATYPKELGIFLFWQKRFAEAEECYRQTLILNPKDQFARANLAATLARLPGRDTEAEILFQEVIGNAYTSRSIRARTHGQYGGFLAFRERWEEAVFQFEASLELRENSDIRHQYQAAQKRLPPHS